MINFLIAFRQGFMRGLRDAWSILKFLLLLGAILAFCSCCYYLDHLRFTP